MMQLACDADASGQKPVPLGGKIICISCSEMLHEVRVYYSGKLGTTNRRRHNSIMKNSHFKIRDGSVPPQGVQKVSKARQTDTMVVEGSLMVPARGATPEASIAP